MSVERKIRNAIRFKRKQTVRKRLREAFKSLDIMSIISRDHKMVEHTPDQNLPSDIKLTDDREINKQLIVYFWWLVCLTFLSQIIGYVIQYISGVISVVVMGILVLGSVNTLIIGGGVKLVQKQMSKLSEQYNAKLKEKKASDDRNLALENENISLKKQLNDRDAELIALKFQKKSE